MLSVRIRNCYLLSGAKSRVKSVEKYTSRLRNTQASSYEDRD